MRLPLSSAQWCAVVFCARYVDLFWNFSSMYNWVLKICWPFLSFVGHYLQPGWLWFSTNVYDFKHVQSQSEGITTVPNSAIIGDNATMHWQEGKCHSCTALADIDTWPSISPRDASSHSRLPFVPSSSTCMTAYRC